MIIEKNGRSRSIRTAEEAREILRTEFSSLTPEEQDAIRSLLEGMATGEEIPSILLESEYERTPVDTRTFVLDPYYLGNVCGSIFPKLMDDLDELFDGTYQECILTGSIGYGKTFFASIGICRVLYELSCLKNPQKTFGLAPGSNLSLVMLSVNQELATKVVYDNIVGKIQASPYFKEHFPFEVTKKELRFPNEVWVAPRASSDTSVLGLNVFGGIIDETNFMTRKGRSKTVGQQQWGHYDRAETLYSAIQRRMKSRFQRHGRVPGILFVVSSKKVRDDFTARRIRDSKHDSSIFVRDYALWDVRPEEYYAQKKFIVLCGNDKTPSRIVDEKEDIAKLKAELPEDVVLIEVPEDFRNDFQRDLEGSIRDIAGVATVAVSPFITRREKIEEAIDPSRVHPFTAMVLDPSKGGMFRWESMVEERNVRLYRGGYEKQWQPKLSPASRRHVHIDPSLRGDATGFVMAHVAGYTEVVRRVEGGGEYTERAPVIVVDVALRIVPPVGDEIVLSDIRQMVYELSAHGYSIGLVTMDQYQSADAIQKFVQKGFPAELLSVDRTMDPYDSLKMALYENRLKMYNYPPLLDELRTLEKDLDRKKVDHPLGGSKDIADALAGVCFSLSQRATHQPLPFFRTSQLQGDAWLPEQRQAMLAGDEGASKNESVWTPPFLRGSGD